MSEITWGDCSDSEFLKKEDILPPDGKTVTIEAFERKLIKGQGHEPDKKKVCVKFEELDKWLVLNATNSGALSTLTRSRSPAESVGKQIDLFVDPDVTFGTQTVGGIRFKDATEIPF